MPIYVDRVNILMAMVIYAVVCINRAYVASCPSNFWKVDIVWYVLTPLSPRHLGNSQFPLDTFLYAALQQQYRTKSHKRHVPIYAV